jgi:AraC-like DNA-binding protein
MSQQSPPTAPRGEQNENYTIQIQPSPASLIIDATLQAKRLDELEDVLKLFSPQSLRNASAGNHADGKLAFRGTDKIGVFKAQIGRDIDIVLEPEATDDRVAFVVATAGAGEFLLNGRTFPHSPNQAIIMSSGVERTFRVAQETETKSFLISRERITECCAKLLGHDSPGFVNFDVSASLDTSSGRTWMRLLSYAEAELADPYSLIRQSPAALRQFEQQLLTGFLLSHRHDHSRALMAPQAAAVPFYVKRAEAYIEAHFAEPLSLADIAAQAGVSARSLQNGFQSFRNITPMGFLRLVRLRSAHEALLVADPAATVTQIALACGFPHMGQFGNIYRRVFGETPKQTLQRGKRL